MNVISDFAPVDLQQSSHDHVHSLLAIIADPEKHRARLDELKAQEDAANERIAIQDAREVETRRLNTQAQAAMIVAANRKTALDAREAELDARQKTIESSEAARSDAALRRRETDVSLREGAATRREAAAAEREAAYETKIALYKKLHQEASL